MTRIGGGEPSKIDELAYQHHNTQQIKALHRIQLRYKHSMSLSM